MASESTVNGTPSRVLRLSASAPKKPIKSTEFFRYTIKSSVFCSRFSRGTLKARGLVLPRRLLRRYQKNSAWRPKASFGRWIFLEGPQTAGPAKPEAERASAGRRELPRAVPAGKRDRTEVWTRTLDQGFVADDKRRTVIRAASNRHFSPRRGKIRASAGTTGSAS